MLLPPICPSRSDAAHAKTIGSRWLK